MDEQTEPQTFWRKFEPKVPLIFHYSIAMVMWIYVGQLLISFGIHWFQEKVTQYLWIFILASVLGALSIFIFGFTKVAKKNIKRLQQKREKICIFAFMDWKSYVIVVFMMGLGITLRTIIGPNEYLGVMYISIGGGLLLSGLIYFKPIYCTLKSLLSRNKSRRQSDI